MCTMKKANIQIYACILCLQAKRNSNASQMWYLEDGTALKDAAYFKAVSFIRNTERR